jgi:hypothetical protein
MPKKEMMETVVYEVKQQRVIGEQLCFEADKMFFGVG